MSFHNWAIITVFNTKTPNVDRTKFMYAIRFWSIALKILDKNYEKNENCRHVDTF